MSTYRSGLGAQLGVAKEETYGTYKAPSRFLKFENESLALTRNAVETQVLEAGNLVQDKDLHNFVTKIVNGDISMPFFDQGMGILLNLLHGNTVEPAKVSGKEKAYEQTHEIGTTTPYGKSLTFQVGRPNTAGTVEPMSYLGCKVTNFGLSVASGGVAMLALTILGRDEKTSETLGEATYASGAVPFRFDQCSVKAGGATLANARDASISYALPQPERYLLGTSGLTSEPIVNALADVVGNTTLEFANLTDHERFTKEEVVELVLLGEGAEIESEGVKFTVEVTIPAAKQTTPAAGPVPGPDILTSSVSFKGLYDGENAPLKIKIISTDSTL